MKLTILALTLSILITPVAKADLSDDCAAESLVWLSEAPAVWLEKACGLANLKLEACGEALRDTEKGQAFEQELIELMKQDCVNYYSARRTQA